VEGAIAGESAPAERHGGAQHRSMPFEILDLALVLLGRCSRIEGSEIAAFPGVGVLLARIETIFARFELADHAASTRSGGAGAVLIPVAYQ